MADPFIGRALPSFTVAAQGLSKSIKLLYRACCRAIVPAMDKQSWEGFWKHSFEGMNRTFAWLQNAEGLRDSADVLFTAYLESFKPSLTSGTSIGDTRIARAATLLYGLAMENILKAVLIKESIAKVKADGTISWNGVGGATDHDLVSISRSSKVNLNVDQERLMERMSAFVHWAGKYPTPLKFKDMKNGKDLKGLLLSGQPREDAVTLPGEFCAEDKRLFEVLYGMLLDRALGDEVFPNRDPEE